MSLVLAVAALAALPVQASAQAPQTDTTFAVAQGARLRLNNGGGDIVIRAWERNQVRIQANHSRRTRVAVEASGAVIEVESRATHGPGNMVDYQITVPAWMPLDLEGMYAYIDVEGVRGAINAETLEGDITIKGPTAQLKASTTSGKISVEGARGRVELNSTSESIRVADVQGDLFIEGLSGDIILRGVRAASAEVETLSGNLVYEGVIQDGGRYTFLTHSGNISISIQEGANATIATAVGSGEVGATFTLPASERPGRRRQTFRLGSGSASIEAETFSGNVRLYRPAELQSWLQQAEERRKARQRPKPEHDAGSAHDQTRHLESWS